MNKPVALLMNDLHIDKDNISEFQKNWDEALSVAKENGVKDIVIGGDLWTSRASQNLAVLSTVRSCILNATVNFKLTIANGNHCKVEQESVIGYSTIFSEYQNVWVVDTYKFLDWDDDGVVLAVMSYFPENGSFKDKLKEMVEKMDEYGIDKSDVVLYIHEGIHGALGKLDVSDELPQDIFDGFGSVLVGHYHNRVKIRGTNIQYIGSSRQLSFGEDEEKGYTILYDDGHNEFIKNKVNVRYKTISLRLDELDKIKDMNLTNDGSYKYRLRLACKSDEIATIDRQKLSDMGFCKIEFVTEKIEAAEIGNTSIDEKFDKIGIQKEYVSFCDNKEIDSELGLKYLKN